MSKWKQISLGELYDVHNGLSKSRDAFGHGYPFLSFSEVFNNYFLPGELKQLVESTPQEQESYSIHRGDVFITRTSETMDELGMSCVALRDYPQATYNGFTKRLRPKFQDRILPEYAGYFLRTPLFRSKFVAFSTMTTRASLRNEDLLAMKISLPPIEMQRKIADILSAYDDLIENNRKQIKLLEEAAQRLYKEWFIDLRFPGHETTKIVDGIPEGWERKQLSSIIKLRSGFAFKSKDFASDGMFRIVTIKNVQDGIFDYENTDTIAEIPRNMPKYCTLSDGDILLSLTGNIGRVCMVTEKKCLLNQRVAKLETQYPGFAYCLFRNKDFCYSINTLANGAAQQNLSPIKAEGMEILIPEKKLLEIFEETSEKFTTKILFLFKSITELKKAQNCLLPKLMNGELEVENEY